MQNLRLSIHNLFDNYWHKTHAIPTPVANQWQEVKFIVDDIGYFLLSIEGHKIQ